MSNDTDLKEFVKKQAAGMRRGGTAILIAGIVLIIALLILYTYSLNRLHKEWEADGVVSYASSMALVYLDDAIEDAGPWVLDNAPKLMDQAKDQMVAYAPKLRENVESYLNTVADNLVSRVHDAASQQVRDLMASHGQQFRAALDAMGDVQKSQTAQDDLQKVLEAEFEQTAVTHLDPSLPELLRVVKEMDEHMKLYAETAPEKLNPEQQLEQEFVIIANTLIERGFSRLRGS